MSNENGFSPLDFDTLQHSPISSDMAASDLHLLGCLQCFLAGKLFYDAEVVKTKKQASKTVVFYYSSVHFGTKFF